MELYGVKYEYSGGSMCFRSEFSVEVRPCEVVRCEFWPEDMELDRVVREHVPVTPERWEDIRRITAELVPLMRRYEPPVIRGPVPRILDGGDYQRIFLDFGGGWVQYNAPDDRRFLTFDALLRETAHPTGREIVWYPAPEACGIFIMNEKKGWSYQLTHFGEGWRYIANDGKNRTDAFVGSEVWERAKPLCDGIDLEADPADPYRDPITATVYRTDGKQKRVKLREEEAERIAKGLKELGIRD